MDTTNAGTPGPGGNIGGDMTRLFAIRRLAKQAQATPPQRPGAVQPPQQPKLARF